MKSMREYAKGWKSPEEKKEARREKSSAVVGSMAAQDRGNREEDRVAKMEAKVAPKDSTKDITRGKNSSDSKGPSQGAFMKTATMKTPPKGRERLDDGARRKAGVK